MNEQPKSKVLIMIIGILLIANIVMLAFFLWNTDSGKRNREGERNSRNAYINDYLEKEVGFNKEQLARYDSLSKKHREQIKATFSQLAAKRKTTFNALVSASFSDTAINDAANEIHERQRGLELSMLRHLKDIRDLCTREQLARFDTSFYKIFGKRGETHKEK